MVQPRFAVSSCAAFIVLLLANSAALAQATRTWVSGVGDDANPCSRTAPCKTFAGAISKTAAGGEINCLDPGGFGGVTITKSITISSEGVEAGVLVSATNGIIVNAGVSDFVILKGLDIEGLGTGTNGIRFLAGGELHVQNCTINRFITSGIGFEPSGDSRLFVRDTIIRNIRTGPATAPTAGAGILVKPGASGRANVSIDNVRVDSTFIGIRAETIAGTTNPVFATVRNSTVAGAFAEGISANSAGASVVLNLDTCMVSNNNAGTDTKAIRSILASSIIRLNNVTVVGNDTGLSSSSSGKIATFGNNHISGNANNGTPTEPVIPAL